MTKQGPLRLRHEIHQVLLDLLGIFFMGQSHALTHPTDVRIDDHGHRIPFAIDQSTALPDGVQVVSHNESRVMIKQAGAWKVVHVHKSPAWAAPHVAPA